MVQVLGSLVVYLASLIVVTSSLRMFSMRPSSPRFGGLSVPHGWDSFPPCRRFRMVQVLGSLVINLASLIVVTSLLRMFSMQPSSPLFGGLSVPHGWDSCPPCRRFRMVQVLGSLVINLASLIVVTSPLDQNFCIEPFFGCDALLYLFNS